MALSEKQIKFRLSTKGTAKVKSDFKKTDDAIKKTGKSTKKTKKEFDRFRVSTSGVRRQVGALRNNLLLVSFAMATVGAVFIKTTKAFIEQELAVKKLNQALKSTRGVAGITSLELQDLAASLQQVTTFGDEAIIKAQALMLTFTKIGRDVFPQATEAVLDMATVMGQDLQQTVIQVGKALNDPILGVTALRRVGIQLSATQTEQIKKFVELGDVAGAQRIILRELSTQMGGQARIAADTLGGAFSQMKNALGDLGEEIGAANSGWLKDFAVGIKGAAESWTAVLNAMNETNPAIKKVKEEIIRLNEEMELTRRFGVQPTIFGNMREDLLSLNIQLGKAIELLAFLNFQREVMAGEPPEITIPELRREESPFGEEIAGGQKLFAILTKIREESRKRAEEEIETQDKIAQGLRDEQTLKDAMFVKDIKFAMLSQKSAKDAVKAVIRAETAEAIAGYISSVLKTVPFPLNVVLAAAGGAVVGSLMDKALANFATGGDFVTKGPQAILVGDNPGGRERVRVDPIGTPNINGSDTRGNTFIFNGDIFGDTSERLIEMIETGLKTA